MWPAVEAVVKALLRHGELHSDGFQEALGGFDIYSPVSAVQREHCILPPV